ncbi:putative mitochondrial protein, conserved [Onygenales sp. PD_12]|nr:putative mitochondrial protein, conserved [Onygenales sp. PD_12]
MTSPFTPRALQRTSAILTKISHRSHPTRPFSATPLQHTSSNSPFGNGPSPPRLPKEEQEIFQNLQKQSTGAFSTPRTPPKINQSPQSELESSSDATSNSNPQFSATGSGEELHPDLYRGAKPEFEGEQNPKTGEVGGPKNEPLRWGAAGDWSFNGRVTDF